MATVVRAILGTITPEEKTVIEIIEVKRQTDILIQVIRLMTDPGMLVRVKDTALQEAQALEVKALEALTVLAQEAEALEVPEELEAAVSQEVAEDKRLQLLDNSLFEVFCQIHTNLSGSAFTCNLCHIVLRHKTNKFFETCLGRIPT